MYTTNIYEKNNLMRNIVKDMILTTPEVEAMIGLSRQRINTLLRNDELPILKTTTNGNLFLKADIEAYLSRKLNANHLINRTIEGNGSTFHTNKLFDEMQERFDEVEMINIYATSSLAIMDGYASKSEYRINGMTELLGPTFVVQFANGEERWFDGYNCGYGGTGPNGSVNALVKLGVDRTEAEKLFSINRISFVREESGWKMIDRSLNKQEKHLNVSLYSKDGYLIMLQNASSVYEKDNAAIEFLKNYKYFLPEPTTVEFFTREEAIEKGYLGGSVVHPKCYQIIITDVSGRQIWLDYPVEKESIKYDTTLRDILLMTGLVMPEDVKQSAFAPLLNWLNKKIRVIAKNL